jgi:hypothetical protein
MCPANQEAWLTGESLPCITAVLLLHPHSIRKVNLVENNTLGKTLVPSIWRYCCIIKSAAAANAFKNLPSHKLAQSGRD